MYKQLVLSFVNQKTVSDSFSQKIRSLEFVLQLELKGIEFSFLYFLSRTEWMFSQLTLWIEFDRFNPYYTWNLIMPIEINKKLFLHCSQFWFDFCLFIFVLSSSCQCSFPILIYFEHEYLCDVVFKTKTTYIGTKCLFSIPFEWDATKNIAISSDACMFKFMHTETLKFIHTYWIFVRAFWFFFFFVSGFIQKYSFIPKPNLFCLLREMKNKKHFYIAASTTPSKWIALHLRISLLCSLHTNSLSLSHR